MESTYVLCVSIFTLPLLSTSYIHYEIILEFLLVVKTEYGPNKINLDSSFRFSMTFFNYLGFLLLLVLLVLKFKILLGCVWYEGNVFLENKWFSYLFLVFAK